MTKEEFDKLNEIQKNKLLLCYLYEYFYDVNVRKVNHKIIRELLENKLKLKEDVVYGSNIDVDKYVCYFDDDYDTEKAKQHIFIYPKTQLCEDEIKKC